MKRYYVVQPLLTLCAFAIWISLTPVAVVAQDDLGIEDAGVEVLARGPIHEAFAAPVVFDPEPAAGTTRHPPEAIEEMPPDQKPEGNRVVWIGGYWSWDEDYGDFIWVSGIWRVVPPGRFWAPGYWRGTPEGAQWISGYWRTDNERTVEYLPPPPANIEVGPSSESPTPEHSWIPGCWTWRETRYVWRPGYWIVCDPEWVWVPAQYVWTPSGCVYVAGYWDYAPTRRGVVFAPVRVSSVVYTRPTYVYSPSVVIDVDVAVGHLFARPRVRHYYFGDYYAHEYVAVGIYPSFAFHFSRYGYDPIYAREVVVHRRTDPSWEVSVRAAFFDRRDRVELRPARTYVTRRVAVTGTTVREARVVSLARPLSEVTARPESGARFVRIDSKQRENARRVAGELRDYRRQRAERETTAPAVKLRDTRTARRVEMPRSPDRERSPTVKTDRRPPPRPVAPRPDAKAKAKSAKRPDPRETLRRP